MRSSNNWRELDTALFSRRDNGYHNFGDNLDRFLHWEITGTHLPEGIYLAVGSVMRKAGGKIVWGSGFGSPADRCGKPVRVCAVRGKLTRQRLLELGYECPEVYGDPALLLPRYLSRDKALKRSRSSWRSHIGFVAHKRDVRTFPRALLIHPEQNHPFDYIAKLLSCDLIASSSLHGCITADAYGIPNVWVGFPDRRSDQSHHFKYRDYYSAVDLEYEPVSMTEAEVMRLARVHPTPDLDKLLEACPFSSASARRI